MCFLVLSWENKLNVSSAVVSLEPEILLVDEPTSSLDPESAAAIESLIELLKTHHTILLVTHRHEQAEKVSDNLMFCNIIR